MAQKRVSVRLVAEGGRQVKAEFAGVGDAGENSFRRIERQADITGAVVRRVMGILGAAISTRIGAPPSGKGAFIQRPLAICFARR